MIRGMVDRLAARLQEHPDDIEGWRRLARVWEVLGEPEKAAAARARTRKQVLATSTLPSSNAATSG